MDRPIIYPGQIPLETDLLNTNRNTMVALGKLISDVIGTATVASGLVCSPTGPATLNVQVGPGQIYGMQNLDGTAYSSLAADTTHQIAKQGILLDAVTLACPAPGTAGYSINYLIEATYQDVDSVAVALPYYNASNPTQAYTGPNNSGAAQATVRKGTVVLQAKAGIAAATGTQTTPAADAGYVGLWVVTVANGQATIVAGNITQAPGAPFLTASLFTLLSNLASTTDPTLGAAMSGFNGSLSYTGWSVGRKLLERISVMDIIPPALHAAIKAGTSTVDVIDYFNTALAQAMTVLVPAGSYFISRPINCTARRNGSGLYASRQLIGEGASLTIINAYTGNYPCLDLTGSSNGKLQGINFRSDNPGAFGLSASQCASIGIVNRRGSTSAFTQVCHQNRFDDIRLNMTSDMTRNGGVGTVGFYNVGGEHLESPGGVQIYANVPLAMHNVAQYTVSNSSDIPTYGVQYEPPYAGSPVSCTIFHFPSWQLISYDSFRAIDLWQVSMLEMPSLYTSTHKLVASVPAYKETINLAGSCANIFIEAYQEASGLFGATYRMDHRYLTYAGDNENINLTIQRGIGDYGFTLPGAAEPSVMALNAGYLANSRINCNYLIGIYNSSGDNNGFAALPVAITGTPNGFRNVEFTLDRLGAHSADIFSVIGPYCTNVTSRNYLSGDDCRGDSTGTWTPVVIGLTTAGVGTYSFRAGYSVRSGKLGYITCSIALTAHTGTGGMAISGLPWVSDPAIEQALSVKYDGLAVGAGKQLLASIPNNQSVIILSQGDPAGGTMLGVPVDGVVTSLVISGNYKIA